MDAYAVIETGGKQYRVKKGDVLEIERLEGEVGQKIKLDRVLALSNGSELTVGTPTVGGASVAAEIVSQHRGEKVVAFKKKRRKGYHRKVGHRQELTQVRVDTISA
jgi:large subunit ribosomal protein L21